MKMSHLSADNLSWILLRIYDCIQRQVSASFYGRSMYGNSHSGSRAELNANIRDRPIDLIYRIYIMRLFFWDFKKPGMEAT